MNSVWSPLACCFSKGPLKGDFLEICLTTFSDPVISETHELWERSFFGECSNFKIDLNNEEINWENVFSFWDNCIWIKCLNLSLLRREYLSSAFNMFTNIPRSLDISKRHFFRLNYLHIDHSIWSRWCGSNLNCVWSGLHGASGRVLWNGTV